MTKSEPAKGKAASEKEKSAWPRISLITAVFNSRKCIEQTMQSVLAQGYANLEYIVVDGGSTDGTLEIVRKYVGKPLLRMHLGTPPVIRYDLEKGWVKEGS